MPNVEDYLLGTDDTESVRLGVQHRLWAVQAAAIWERAGIEPGSRVLDVGCGPGYAAADIAQLIGPGGRLLGVDGSPEYVAQFADRMDRLGFSHAEVRKGDVHNIASIAGDEAGTFDVAYIRWGLSFSKDPDRLIEQVHKCLKPGGRVAIQDYFGYASIKLAPKNADFQRGIAAVAEYWTEHGDLDVMGEMPRILRETGFEVREFEVVQRLARPGNQIWNWPDIFWPSFIPRVVEAGYLTRAEADAFMAAWRSASASPDSFLLLPPVFEAIGVKR